MNWLKRLMSGRYGGDQLSIALLIFSLILTLLSNITRIPYISLIGFIPLAIGLFRTFSKNISKRSMENYKFAMLISPIYAKYNRLKRRAKDSKTNKFFKCPNCKTKLRVPRGKGKIIITCPRCKTRLTKKT